MAKKRAAASDSKRDPLAFISYRRQDSAAAARWLFAGLRQTFGPESVFMDVDAIRSSDKWALRIDDALSRATLVIAVIGPHWLRIPDEFGQRRLDKGDDWVRNEIARSLKHHKPLLPVLLSKTPMPAKAALPEPIHSMVEHQAFDLRDERWEQDISALLAMIESLGFRRTTATQVRYPKPRVTLAELTAGETAKTLRKLPAWEQVVSPIPGKEPQTRVELRRIYEFESFEDALDFMVQASSYASTIEHHPRWENLWRSVTVCLTTWDIGHRPSVLDVDLAVHLDATFKKYESRRPVVRRARSK